MNKEEKKLYKEALTIYGRDSQIFMLFEECGELLNAVAKKIRGRCSEKEVITELADVVIMCEQMALLFCKNDDCEEYYKEKELKKLRLKERINSHLK